MAKKNTIYTSMYYADTYVKEFAEQEGITVEEANSREWEDELFDFCDTMRSLNYQDLYEEIVFYEKEHGQKDYVVLATIGSWNGTHEGGKIITGMFNVLAMCTEDEVTLYQEGRKVCITASHHDGTNFFRIKELTKEGERYKINHDDMSDRELHAKLFNDSHLSRHPVIFKEIYGF